MCSVCIQLLSLLYKVTSLEVRVFDGNKGRNDVAQLV